MTVPTDKDVIEHFTPESLENVEPKPVFRFRAATARDAQRYNHLLNLEGLRLHNEATIREQIRNVLKENWDEDTYAKHIQRLETAWAMTEQGIPIPPAEQSAIAELIGRCMDVDPLLRRMDADNRSFAENAPGVALSMFLVGWKNLDVPFRREANVVPFETLLELSTAIRKLEREASADKVEGVVEGLAFLQLSLKGFQLLSLNKDEEKNSSAPSPSSDSPNGSKSETKPDGASASGTSGRTKTRARASRPKR